MLKYYVKTTEALKRLRTDQDGMVSFEYIIVAVCVIGAVAAVFGGTGATSIQNTLSGGLVKVSSAFNNALP